MFVGWFNDLVSFVLPQSLLLSLIVLPRIYSMPSLLSRFGNVEGFRHMLAAMEAQKKDFTSMFIPLDGHFLVPWNIATPVTTKLRPALYESLA